MTTTIKSLFEVSMNEDRGESWGCVEHCSVPDHVLNADRDVGINADFVEVIVWTPDFVYTTYLGDGDAMRVMSLPRNPQVRAKGLTP